MPKRKTPAKSATPQDIAASIAARKPLGRARDQVLDRTVIAQASQRAAKTADRLIEEMAEVLRHLYRKR